MDNAKRACIAIDLKSYYASVECVERGLDPLDTNLVVADESRSTGTICLAVSPPLKAQGVPGRPRLFEVIQKVKEINNKRKYHAPGRKLVGASISDAELKANPAMALSYITAMPRMGLYIEYSSRIYQIYLRFVAPEDIVVYSIDEVFIDVTPYLGTYGITAHELAMEMVRAVLRETGVTATAGIGTNLYLAKVAMDIVAKKMPADKDGVRIAELDESTYQQKLWSHVPLTDFWRIGPGTAARLEKHNMFTMGDIARCSIGKSSDYWNENLLYKLFGVNAELLIDHAWGWEPCTIEDIKAYKPQSKSLSSGQVLPKPYPFAKARLIVWEMTDLLALDLVAKELLTDQMVLYIGYDKKSLDGTAVPYDEGLLTADRHGRIRLTPAHGSVNLGQPTSSAKKIVAAVLELFDSIVNPYLLVRRVNICANHVSTEAQERERPQSFDLFADLDEQAQAMEQERRERAVQKAVLKIQHKYGKNALLKASNLEEDAMTKERNQQIGGHRA
ncbi:MAG: DNA methylase [Schwartzia succinivorans]|nr:DNA methylase [Schwartzia succinivorans]